MYQTPIRLESVEQIKKFVNTVAVYDCDFDLESGRYVIDAKSIMGIFSLDLLHPTSLIIHSNDEAEIAKIREDLAEFIG
ncbi:MAG: HPr family phosphocarrier protein [Lachnospiraceae bacterium]|nr:HPr family phosphocarrier protein [Lachnospiraceae bacterium]